MSTNDPPDDEVMADVASEESTDEDDPTEHAHGQASDETDSDALFDERITSYSWLAGGLAGIGTFLAGFAVMAGVMIPTANFSGSSLVAQLRAVGNVYYNAHLIPMANTVDGSPVQIPGLPADYLAAGGTSLPVAVYYAVPVVVLLASGAILAARTHSEAELAEYALPGISITVGYLVMALFARLFVEESIGGVATRRPELLPTVIYGLAFPLALATLGGLAVGTYRTRVDADSQA